MNILRRFYVWMFDSRRPDSKWWQVVLWWEARRIPYNVLVGTWAVICFAIFLIALQGSGGLKPGEDAEEPLALLAAPFLINACYTLGWLVELPARAMSPAMKERIGPGLMKLGVAFSLFCVTVPAAIWVVMWVLKLAHLVKVTDPNV
jgi:hypothetical protein